MSFHVSFCSCFFSPFSIAITSLGEERANLSALRTFVRFVLVWICRFPLPLGVWEGLRFVIVTLPGFFSYLFFFFFLFYLCLLIAINSHSFKNYYLSTIFGVVASRTSFFIYSVHIFVLVSIPDFFV